MKQRPPPLAPQVLERIPLDDVISTREISRALGLSGACVLEACYQLEEKGKIERVGKAGGSVKSAIIWQRAP